MKLSAPLRHLLLVAAATLVAALAAALILPAPADLAVDAKKGLPFYELPFGDNPFAPGELKTTDKAMVDWRGVPSARACAECHRQEFMEWTTSIHAVSDEDLIYATTVDENTTASKAAAAHGDAKGRWCESCHNPLGTLTGMVAAAPSVPRTETMEEGVTCIVCHTAVHAEPLAGNGALTVKLNDIFRHVHPALIMAAPARHAKDMQAKRDAPLMGSSALCGACHTEIRPTAVNGQEPMNFQDTYDEWRRSPWAEKGVQCQDCHMARDPAATVAALKRGEKPPRGVSHRIAGNNYLLADPDLPGNLMTTLRNGLPGGVNRIFQRDEYVAEQRRTRDQITALLKEAAEIQVENAVDRSNRASLAVTVANRGAGHALPTGPLDQRYMWLEVEVTDGDGRPVFHSGAFDATKGEEDPNAVRWVKVMIDGEGQRDLRHLLFDTDRLYYPRKPIPAGASERIDYALPALPPGQYAVRVRLWYRLAFQGILKNFESQGPGKVDVIIPPLSIAETTGELRIPARVADAAKGGRS
jgi:hypothetical protein